MESNLYLTARVKLLQAMLKILPSVNYKNADLDNTLMGCEIAIALVIEGRFTWPTELQSIQNTRILYGTKPENKKFS